MYLSDEEEDFNFLSLSKFESMLKTNKILFFDSEEFEEIILHYLDTGKANLAKKALNLALDQHPNSTGLKLVQVEMFIYNEKLDAAEKLLNELHAIEPQNEEIFIQRATIFSKKNEHDKAIESLKTALNFTDDKADVYNLLGMEFLFTDNLEQAKESFIKCLEEDDYDQSSLYNVVYCFEFLDQTEEAIAFLDQYLDKNPYSEIAWHQSGRLYYSLEMYTQALRAFEYATLIDEGFLGAFMEKGKSLERLKRYEEAIVAYNKTIELKDPTSYAFLRIGKCYEALGDKELALEYYNQTVHEDPLLDKGWIAITDLFLKDKDYKKALHYLNEALSIDNENGEYWKRYATLHKELNILAEAELGYRKAVEFCDVEIDNWLYWVDYLQFTGELELAVKTLLDATEFFPEAYEIEYRLAGLYYTLGKDKKGKFHLSNALRLDSSQHTIIEKSFPEAWKRKVVQNIISKYLESDFI